MKTKAITVIMIVLFLVGAVIITAAAFNEDLLIPRGNIPFVGMNLVMEGVLSKMGPDGLETQSLQRVIVFSGVPLNPDLTPVNPNYIIVDDSYPVWKHSIVDVLTREIVETTGDNAQLGWKVSYWIDPKVKVGSEVGIQDFTVTVIGTAVYAYQSKEVPAWVLYGVKTFPNGNYQTYHAWYERRTGLALVIGVVLYDADGDIILSGSSSLVSTNAPI